MDEKDFNFLFALKLRQYNDNLFEVEDFVRDQLVNTFNSNVKSCIEYLNITLFQYNYLFSEGLKVQIKDILTKLEFQEAGQSKSDSILKGNNLSEKRSEFCKGENNTLKDRTITKKQGKSRQIRISERKDTISKNDTNTRLITKIWTGSDSQLKIFYNCANDELFNGVSIDEFINHFTDKDFQYKINWFAGNNAFIETFDKLATEKLINKQFIKPNNQFKNRYVILISKINKHFVFNGIEKDSATLSKSRYQFYQSEGKSDKHEIILKLINEILNSH